MTRSKDNWWIPVGSFGIAVVLAFVAGPSPLICAVRSMQETTDGRCHQFKETHSEDECTGETNGVSDPADAGLCDLIVPNPAPGVIGENRRTRKNSEFGDCRHGLGGRAGARLSGEAPVKSQIRKRLKLIKFSCPDLPHDVETVVGGDLRIRIQIPDPLVFGDSAFGSALVTMDGSRRSDMGLNDNDAESLFSVFEKSRNPQGQLEETATTTVQQRGRPPVTRPAKRGVPRQDVVLDREPFNSMQEITTPFRVRAEVDYTASVHAIRLKAPRNQPPGDPDDDGNIRASCVAEVQDPRSKLRDVSESLGF